MKALKSPCHTIGHTLFYLESITKVDNEYKESISSLESLPLFTMNKVIFTGDTIFIGGCGKFFEGTGEDMQKNVDTVKGLPEDTYMFPGHDYTEANLKWAEGIEWENGAYMNLLLKLAERIEKDPKVLGKYFMPTSLKEEKESNIFFRTDNAV